MSNSHYVYGLYDKENNCYIYIGKGSGNRVYYHRRAVERNYLSTRRNPDLYARLSYLVRNDLLREDILEHDLSESVAYCKEEYYTRKYGLLSEGGTLYNRCYGHWVMTDEARANMQVKRSKTISMKYRGSGNPFYGKHHSEETKLKIAEGNKGFSGRSHTESHKKYMSDKLKGRTFSESTIDKMRGPNKKTKTAWVYDTKLDKLMEFHSRSKCYRDMATLYPEYKFTRSLIDGAYWRGSLLHDRFYVSFDKKYVVDSRITFND